MELHARYGDPPKPQWLQGHKISNRYILTESYRYCGLYNEKCTSLCRYIIVIRHVEICWNMLIFEMCWWDPSQPRLCFHTMDPGTVDTKMLRAGWGCWGSPVSTATTSFEMLTQEPRFSPQTHTKSLNRMSIGAVAGLAKGQISKKLWFWEFSLLRWRGGIAETFVGSIAATQQQNWIRMDSFLIRIIELGWSWTSSWTGKIPITSYVCHGLMVVQMLLWGFSLEQSIQKFDQNKLWRAVRGCRIWMYSFRTHFYVEQCWAHNRHISHVWNMYTCIQHARIGFFFARLMCIVRKSARRVVRNIHDFVQCQARLFLHEYDHLDGIVQCLEA